MDVVPESDAMIQNWAVAGEQIFVSYVRKLKTEIDIFDLDGKRLGHLPLEASEHRSLRSEASETQTN